MTNPNRLGAKLAAASLIALATACAGPGTGGPRSASIFGDKVDTANIGLATKAQLALAANDIATAIPLAERAVERSPNDAGFRALLGNCYLAAGRFTSAEAAYRDSLSLVANQPQLILKLALVMTALGKSGEAIRMLAEAQSVIDPADLGLALTLAGDPQSALQVLDPAARATSADSRTRQNLALAHAFAGNWEQARLIAAQDIPADQVDARMTQWMALAKPARASDQVAAFIGVTPVAGDPGQPKSVGQPLPGVKARICHHETGVALAAGEVGEIRIKGPLFLAYYKDADKTRASYDADGFFHTGDLGMLDSAGRLYYRGRLKEMVKSGGINIAPIEVEEALMRHPEVRTAYVIGVPHAELDEVLAAIVVPKDGKQPSADALTLFCKQELAAYKVPAHFRFVTDADLPLTTTGKVQKMQLHTLL